MIRYKKKKQKHNGIILRPVKVNSVSFPREFKIRKNQFPGIILFVISYIL